jgi:hypothetical protein
MGIISVYISINLVRAGSRISKFSYFYAVALAAGLIPITYLIAMMLVFLNFYLASVTGLFARLLMTELELALLIIAARGQATIGTALCALFLIADEVRGIILSSP